MDSNTARWLMLLGYLLFINTVTYIAFGHDKRRAQLGARRIPELNLLGLAAVGGSVGAVIAQQRFHHKTRKQPFASILTLLIGVQIVAVIGMVALCR